MNDRGNLLNNESDNLDLIKEIKYYLFFWPWFLVSLILFVFSSFVYLRYSNPVYNTSATLQVKDLSSDPSSFLTQSAGAMFNFNKVKIDNYTTQISSNPNLFNVVKSLDLQTNIYSLGRVKSSLQFADEIPFEIKFKTDKIFNEGFSVKFNSSKSSLEIDGKSYNISINQILDFEDFNLTFLKIPENDVEFLVKRFNENVSVSNLFSNVNITPSSKDGDNIDISLNGSNIQRNEAIINKLIQVAHLDQVNDKRQIYSLSIDFINSRLESIINEIDTLSIETTGFKSDNLIFSPEAQTENALSSLTKLEQDKFDLTTQLELAKSLKENLKSQTKFSLLPSNIGINSGNVNELVVAFNTLVLERNNLLSGATELNPLIVQLSQQLTDLKQNINISIDNYLDNLNTSLSKFNEFKSNTSSQVARIPKLEAKLLAFQRKFQLAENLYIFLLKRREEASISYEATLPNTRVINYANTSPIPISPKKQLIFLGSILLGLLVPFGVLYILKLTDTKIHKREDLEKELSNLNILGEIPFVEESNTIDDPRGAFAEASRVIRSNISFKLPNSDKCQVILSTSSIKGEGKTLTIFNLAASYVAAGNKVLLIGADLRNPQLHTIMGYDRKSGSEGLSTILSKSRVNPSDNVVTVDIFSSSIDVMLSGPIPPNPAELLNSDKFSNLLNQLKNNYDYILIDSAPMLLVSDTIPILKYADLVVYTTRAHYTDKKILPFIDNLVSDKKINNIGLVLNGIKVGPKSYYKYGYSYRYSYSYKYNYGYGYGYNEDKEIF